MKCGVNYFLEFLFEIKLLYEEILNKIFYHNKNYLNDFLLLLSENKYIKKNYLTGC